jgi:hypothetical protein
MGHPSELQEFQRVCRLVKPDATDGELLRLFNGGCTIVWFALHPEAAPANADSRAIQDYLQRLMLSDIHPIAADTRSRFQAAIARATRPIKAPTSVRRSRYAQAMLDADPGNQEILRQEQRYRDAGIEVLPYKGKGGRVYAG